MIIWECFDHLRLNDERVGQTRLTELISSGLMLQNFVTMNRRRYDEEYEYRFIDIDIGMFLYLF